MAADVTLEVLAERIGALIESNTKEYKSIADNIKSLKDKLDTMNGRQRDDHDQIVCLETQLNVRTGILVATQFALSSIAGFLGMRE